MELQLFDHVCVWILDLQLQWYYHERVQEAGVAELYVMEMDHDEDWAKHGHRRTQAHMDSDTMETAWVKKMGHEYDGHC